MLNNSKNIYMRCDCNCSSLVFAQYKNVFGDIYHEINVEDSYCRSELTGIKGRFKRAWHAFWGQPIYYAGIFCEDKEKTKKFLQDCLDLIATEEE